MNQDQDKARRDYLKHKWDRDEGIVETEDAPRQDEPSPWLALVGRILSWRPRKHVHAWLPYGYKMEECATCGCTRMRRYGDDKCL